MDAVMTRQQAYEYALFLLDAEIAELSSDDAGALQAVRESLTLQDLDDFYTEEDAFYDSHNVARFMPADVKDAIQLVKNRLSFR